jgi:hypothetical protein
VYDILKAKLEMKLHLMKSVVKLAMFEGTSAELFAKRLHVHGDGFEEPYLKIPCISWNHIHGA